MDSLFSSELSLLGSVEGLREDGCGMGWPSSPLSEDMYPSSHFALAAAYHDIKSRLASLERENISIKHKLKNYEFPMISEFGEERSPCCSCDPKESSLMMSDSSSLQQNINSLTQELLKSKEREERLEDVIQAYEKIHLEKSNVQRDLDKMTTLAEQHVERICGLEAAVRQRDDSLQKLSSRLRSGKDSPLEAQQQPYVRTKDTHHLQLHTSLDVYRECRGPTLQSSRSLDALSDLKVQRLEAELEGARHEAQDACQREEELKAELQQLQEEIRQLQESQTQEMPATCEHCDVEWIKKAGDEQVNLALAYTELTEELGRVRSLAAKQSEILRQSAQEQQSPVSRHSPASQRCSPSSQRPSPDRLRPSPPISPPAGPTSYTSRPPTRWLRERFQGRRSYSEMSDPSSHGRQPIHARLLCDPVSTLPKPRSMGGGEAGGYQWLPRASLGSARPASAHGGSLGGGLGGSLGGSPARRHHGLELGFPLVEMRHLCRLENPSMVAALAPTPLVTPPQSSDEEEEDWHCPSPVQSPPRTLGAILPPCPPFPAPEGPSTLTCHLQGHLHADHCQSWPSINLWMETEENAARSCPLCQLTFPTNYPDDALIKHIDTHLENSKI
ncbi:TANK-binding kinase 1-binding protein 1-like isoform X2 [Clupea harengus]|uniref:TANK-binding kinase 1-binding protein 1-like isoform X2 n=1 Tax=Clupea harengus TaxID=7950 RepID=A0A6P8FVG3_CLUHA|nr:TANK-binding kinase 1-binding protein 1-like isoform X2 [Clupea harengus]